MRWICASGAAARRRVRRSATPEAPTVPARSFISSTVGVLLGFALAAVLLVVAWRARRTALAWVLAVLAWLVSAAGCVWPLVATGFAAADRARDVWPTVLEIVRSVS